MTPHYADDAVTLHHGDCLDVLRALPDASVDAVVADPPYSLGFMGRTWDAHRDLDDDPAFGYYLAGLIDGEGCFRIQRHERGTHTCIFSMKLRADDRAILDKAQRWLGAGTINRHADGDARPQVRWAVQDKVGCQRLVDALDKYELRAKKRSDYLAWREAVCEWTSMPRGNRWRGPADQSRMSALKARIEAGRAYVEPPWSGNGYQDWCRLWAAECLRVLKPGGHLLAFGGTRTVHRLTCAIEDAGFEIRDGIDWIYAQGFPKSLDVSKAIDRQRDDRAAIAEVAAWLADQADTAGITRAAVDAHMGTSDMAGWWLSRLPHRAQVPQWAQWLRLRELIGFGDEMDAEVWRLNGRKGSPGEAWAQRELVGLGYRVRRESDVQIVGLSDGEYPLTAPATDASRQWAGWGTALKPAREPIVVARKPLAGTVAANVQAYGTGALNIDAARVAGVVPQVTQGVNGHPSSFAVAKDRQLSQPHDAGRWPSNVVFSHAPDCTDECVPGCPVAELDAQSGVLTSGRMRGGVERGNREGWAGPMPAATGGETYGDSGGASRFFPVFRYEAKAATGERPRIDGVAHPTVKPLDLMRWLVRLVTPPGGIVLDPFAGSGTTAEACVIEGFRCIAIERETDYLPLILGRLTKPLEVTLPLEVAR